MINLEIPPLDDVPESSNRKRYKWFFSGAASLKVEDALWWHHFLCGKEMENLLTEFDIVHVIPKQDGKKFYPVTRKNLLHEVHRFFYGMFCNQSDRSHMLEMITNGGFFAIVNPDHEMPVVIAAISYFRRDHEVIITYFGTKLILCSLGLGQMLLILVAKHCLHFNMKNVTMYLTANAKDNQFSTKWYTKRGLSMTRRQDENWVRFTKLLEGLPAEKYDDDSLELFVLKTFATKFKFPRCAVGQPLSRVYLSL